ncbi:MAG: hypothetical protein P8Z68_00075 [Kineosporiaceae bacterium]
MVTQSSQVVDHAVVERFDYRSEAAFCRTFKRTFGVPPGSVRTAANASVRV